MPSSDAATRIRIVSDRFIQGCTYNDIAANIPDVKANAARMYCTRLQKRYPEDTTEQLIHHAGETVARGKKARVEAGSQASLYIRDSVRVRFDGQDPTEAANRALREIHNTRSIIIRNPEKPLARQQVHNILHSPEHYTYDNAYDCPITRKKPVQKPPLDKLDLDHRERYIEWFLTLDDDNTIIISCDETTLEMGPKKLGKRSAAQGVAVYTDESQPVFTMMQWDAASTETRVKRPVVMWMKETEDEIEALLAQLLDAKKKLKSVVNEQRANALKEGTAENKLMNDLNDGVNEENARRKQVKQRGKLWQWTPERLFPYQKIERDNKKGGIDFVWYAFVAYTKYLFPYYEEIRALNPGKRVMIMEDNVGVHRKARVLLAPLIEEKNIEFIETPVWSPDLNTIEHLHKDQKRLSEDFRFSIRSGARQVKDLCKYEMGNVWQVNEEFDDLCAWRLSIPYLKELMRRSKCCTPAYSNRYKDSIERGEI
jgi:transposase